MNENRKAVSLLAVALLAALLLLLLILPVLAIGGDMGIQTGATPGGPTPHLSVYEPTATNTEIPPTATPEL